MKVYYKLSVVILIFLFVSSCSSIQNPEYKDVKNIEVQDIRTGESTEVDLTADIILYNPNSVGIKVLNTEFDVFLDGKFVTHITQETPFKLKGKEESTLPIEFMVAFDKGDVLSNIGSLLGSLFADKKVSIKTAGFIRVRIAGLPVKIPFENIEEVSLTK